MCVSTATREECQISISWGSQVILSTEVGLGIEHLTSTITELL